MLLARDAGIVDGYRRQAVLTDQAEADIQAVAHRHRQRARCEDHIRLA